MNIQSSSGSGGGSSGTSINVGGYSKKVKDLYARLQGLDMMSQFDEYERVLDELELAMQEEDANAPSPDGGNPDDTPTTTPTTTPPQDGSGIRHELGNGYSYEFDSSGYTNGADVRLYGPDGELINEQKAVNTDSFPNLQDDLKTWYTGQLDTQFEGWNDPTSDLNRTNYPEQFPTPETETSTETPTETPSTSVTLPDGSEYNFGLGTQNQSYNDLDTKLDDLIDDYSDAEGDEKDKLLDNLQQTEKTLVKSAENLTDLSNQMAKKLSEEIALNKDLYDESVSDSTSEERKNEIAGLLASSNQKIEGLRNNYTRATELADNFNNDLATKIDKAVNGEDDGGDILEDAKSFLTWTALGTVALQAGTDLFQTWFGDDDSIDTKSSAEIMTENVQAIKDIMPTVLETQKQFQPEITELENQSTYGKLFGTNPLTDLYNSNDSYKQQYQQYLNGPDGVPNSGDEPTEPLSETDWMQSQIDADPNGEIAQSYADSISQVGASEKLLQRNMTNASNVYKPIEEGGMGFEEDMFRTEAQKKTMSLANELIDSPVNKMLEDSITTELGKGGDMGQEYYSNQKNNILGGMAPSLAKQGSLLSGGVQRLAREMTGDYQRTLNNRQNQAMQFQNNQQNQLTSFSNLANANTLSPTGLFGLGSGSQQVGQNYAQASQPSGSQFLADPTSAYAGAAGQQSLMQDLMNYANQQSFSEKLQNTTNSSNALFDVLERIQDINKED